MLLLMIKQFEYGRDISFLHWSDVSVNHYFLLVIDFMLFNKIRNCFIIILKCETCFQQLFRVSKLMEIIWANVSSWYILKALKATCPVAKSNTPPNHFFHHEWSHILFPIHQVGGHKLNRNHFNFLLSNNYILWNSKDTSHKVVVCITTK